MLFNFKTNNVLFFFSDVYYNSRIYKSIFKELCIGLLPVLCTIDMSVLRLLTKTSTQEKSEFREWLVGWVLSKTNISSFLQQSTCKQTEKPIVIYPCIYQTFGFLFFSFLFFANTRQVLVYNFNICKK